MLDLLDIVHHTFLLIIYLAYKNEIFIYKKHETRKKFVIVWVLLQTRVVRSHTENNNNNNDPLLFMIMYGVALLMKNHSNKVVTFLVFFFVLFFSIRGTISYDMKLWFCMTQFCFFIIMLFLNEILPLLIFVCIITGWWGHICSSLTL